MKTQAETMLSLYENAPVLYESGKAPAPASAMMYAVLNVIQRWHIQSYRLRVDIAIFKDGSVLYTEQNVCQQTPMESVDVFDLLADLYKDRAWYESRLFCWRRRLKIEAVTKLISALHDVYHYSSELRKNPNYRIPANFFETEMDSNFGYPNEHQA